MAIIHTPCDICGKAFHEDYLIQVPREEYPAPGDFCPRCAIDTGAISEAAENEILRWYAHNVGHYPDERGPELRNLVTEYIEAMLEQEAEA